MLQVCLNGPRLPGQHIALPVTPEQLAAAARAAVAAGAADIHLHPKTPDGPDSLDPRVVEAAVLAVRQALPTTPVGVTTGVWTDPAEMLVHIGAWTVRPDHASVNWHLPGADEVARVLLDLGIAVHAGIWPRTAGGARFRASPLRDRVDRILVEVMSPEPGLAEQLLAEVEDLALPVLLHGEDEATWPVLRLAVERGLDTRIGLEDVLVLPDGSPAPDNAALVTAALAVVGKVD
jgi:uncharacterized protein (DUF849 family)